MAAAVGQHAPRAAAAQHAKHGVDDVASVVFGGATAGLGGGDQMSDIRPLSVLEIGGIALPAFGRHPITWQLDQKSAFLTHSDELTVPTPLIRPYLFARTCRNQNESNPQTTIAAPRRVSTAERRPASPC